MIIYLLAFYLFDDIEKKYLNHSCESFCNAKDNFDKSARLHVHSERLIYYRFALGIIHGDRCDGKHQIQLFYSSKPHFSVVEISNTVTV